MGSKTAVECHIQMSSVDTHLVYLPSGIQKTMVKITMLLIGQPSISIRAIEIPWLR